MRRGPKPTPTKTLKLRGSWRAEGRGDLDDIESEAPLCPSWLSESAKQEWRFIVKLLLARGTIQRLDRSVLATHCQAVADYRGLTEQINKFGGFRNDHVKAWNIREKVRVAIYQTTSQLGLSPADRARVPMKKQIVEPKKKGGLAARLAHGS